MKELHSWGNAREAFRKFLNGMAVLGSHAHDRLFRSEDGQILRGALEKHLRSGETIQIAIHSGASDFIWPWAWLYRKFVDPSHRFEADPKLFWGYQYVIEQIANFEASDGDRSGHIRNRRETFEGPNWCLEFRAGDKVATEVFQGFFWSTNAPGSMNK